MKKKSDFLAHLPIPIFDPPKEQVTHPLNRKKKEDFTTELAWVEQELEQLPQAILGDDGLTIRSIPATKRGSTTDAPTTKQHLYHELELVAQQLQETLSASSKTISAKEKKAIQEVLHISSIVEGDHPVPLPELYHVEELLKELKKE